MSKKYLDVQATAKRLSAAYKIPEAQLAPAVEAAYKAMVECVKRSFPNGIGLYSIEQAARVVGELQAAFLEQVADAAIEKEIERQLRTPAGRGSGQPVINITLPEKLINVHLPQQPAPIVNVPPPPDRIVHFLDDTGKKTAGAIVTSAD